MIRLSNVSDSDQTNGARLHTERCACPVFVQLSTAPFSWANSARMATRRKLGRAAPQPSSEINHHTIVRWRGYMNYEALNFARKFGLFDEQWQLKVIAEMNDCQ